MSDGGGSEPARGGGGGACPFPKVRTFHILGIIFLSFNTLWSKNQAKVYNATTFWRVGGGGEEDKSATIF